MKSKPDDNNTDQEYVYSYESTITKAHESRTAQKQGAFFLPYLKPGMTLLDVGCATGSITVGLAEAVSPGQVTGVDISEVEIARARERTADNKISNIRFEVGDAYQLAFPDNSFDALFSHNVLEHIPEPGRALKEMQRVLKPGGVIGIRDVDYGGFLIAPDDGVLERWFAIVEKDLATRGMHTRLGRSLGGLLYEAGFIEVEASASYDVYADPERCRFVAQGSSSRLFEADFVERITDGGLANAEELETIKKAWKNWPEIAGAFAAGSHGEAIGRKREKGK